MTKAEREQLLEEKFNSMREMEIELWNKGVLHVAGVDEVGRGPLAGPVVAACVVLPIDFDVRGIDDSKKLSEKKREELFEKIKEKALAWEVEIVDNFVIDEINILEATKVAMEQAIKKVDNSTKARNSKGLEHILIDALTLKNIEISQSGIIKGDTKSISIAAASIVAKVTRDRLMVEYAVQYPHYKFESNKGYGTKEHLDGIANFGITPIHRKSFLKNIVK